MKYCVKHGNHVGVFLALLFIIAFAWYWIHPVHQDRHLQMLESIFFWFEGMNFLSFISGLIQSYIWGYIFAGLWCLAGYCSAGCCRRES